MKSDGNIVENGIQYKRKYEKLYIFLYIYICRENKLCQRFDYILLHILRINNKAIVVSVNNFSVKVSCIFKWSQNSWRWICRLQYCVHWRSRCIIPDTFCFLIYGGKMTPSRVFYAKSFSLRLNAYFMFCRNDE